MEKGKSSFVSKVPHFNFSEIPGLQEKELANNALITRFVESRRKLSADAHRPHYHFVSPEGRMNDPNGLCRWQGMWHLFYQGYPPEDPRQHWGHAVSPDLVHWRDLPYAIYPDPEECCYSGATLVEDDRVVAMYHGTRAGNMVAVSRDSLLLNWEKLSGKAVIPLPSARNLNDAKRRNPHGDTLPYHVFDPCIWRKDGIYYSLSGGYLPKGPGRKNIRANFLFRSQDLVKWEYMHPFVEDDRFTLCGDDGACPYFLPLGERYILLFFSHMSGGQALLGDYDRERNKFVATAHYRFNFVAVGPCGVHAPSAFSDGQGGIIVIFNMNPGIPASEWDQVMTLPRHIQLKKGEELQIEPIESVSSLRRNHTFKRDIELPGNREVVIEGVGGKSMEIFAEISAEKAQTLEMNVFRSSDREELTRICFFPFRGFRGQSVISIDTSRSSVSPEAASRPPENAPVFVAEKEPLTLRVFIDRSILEVFVNSRQCASVRVYPSREDSTGISFISRGRSSLLKRFDAWQMENIYL